MTLGVRAVVLDGEKSRVLVKHSYVQRLASCRAAALRPVKPPATHCNVSWRKRGRIELTGEPALHGLFFNSHVSRRDHVAVYLVRHFRQDRLPEPTREIVACGFFEDSSVARGDHQGHALADRRSDRRQGADLDLVLGIVSDRSL